MRMRTHPLRRGELLPLHLHFIQILHLIFRSVSELLVRSPTGFGSNLAYFVIFMSTKHEIRIEPALKSRSDSHKFNDNLLFALYFTHFARIDSGPLSVFPLQTDVETFTRQKYF